MLSGGFYFFRGILMKNISNIKKLSVVGMLCALAYLCTFLLHFKVSFLTFDFKDAIIAISALIYGPLTGLLSSAIVAFVEFITVSDTGVYGLIMNFLSSAAFSCTIGLIYNKKRTLQGAVIAVIAAVFAVISVMLLANIFITPFYMGVERGMVISLIPSLLLPFNALKSIINASLTLLIYKPITKIFGQLSLMPKKQIISNKKATVFIVLGAIVIAIIAVIIFIFTLNGKIGF